MLLADYFTTSDVSDAPWSLPTTRFGLTIDTTLEDSTHVTEIAKTPTLVETQGGSSVLRPMRGTPI